MNKKDLVAIRPGVQTDVNFILATWLRGLRYGNDWFEAMESESFFRNYSKIINGLLAKDGVQVAVACLHDDPDVILGYLVSEGDKIHWAHVKSAWRKIGIASSLAPENVKTVTHLTRAGMAILKRRPSIKFDPFAT
jgi:hypothetical protein